MMNLSHQKEQFSIAYVRAVASAAGYRISEPKPDDDSIDLEIAARGAYDTLRSPRIDVQIKCTSQNIGRAKTLNFDLKRKNYEDLRGADFLVPRILVVVTVPDRVSDWLVQSENELIMRYCGYWYSLRRCPPRKNSKVTIQIPRAQIFTVSTLGTLMAIVGKGKKP
jgi:hypothetical protein